MGVRAESPRNRWLQQQRPDDSLKLLRVPSFSSLMPSAVFQRRIQQRGCTPVRGAIKLLDYALVRRRDRHNVQMTKAMGDIDVCTDHRVVIPKIRLRHQPLKRPQGRRPPSKLHTVLLIELAHRSDFINQLASRMDELQTLADNATAQKCWRQLRYIIRSTTLNVLDDHAVKTTIGTTITTK
ncbi:hypothetical protein SprV_0100214300 [Sparganum proliferum]